MEKKKKKKGKLPNSCSPCAETDDRMPLKARDNIHTGQTIQEDTTSNKKNVLAAVQV